MSLYMLARGWSRGWQETLSGCLWFRNKVRPREVDGAGEDGRVWLRSWGKYYQLTREYLQCNMFFPALSHKIRSLWLLAPFADKDISHVSLKPEITELTRIWDSYLVLEL